MNGLNIRLLFQPYQRGTIDILANKEKKWEENVSVRIIRYSNQNNHNKIDSLNIQ